jgi:hypothetical protein
LRKHRSLVVALVLVGLIIALGNWVLHGRDQRASLLILSDGNFSAPELRMQGHLVARPDMGRGPRRHYAWADLRPHLAFTNVEVSWTGADGRRRVLRDVMRHDYEPHCVYLLRLDAVGNSIPALPDRAADGLLHFCHG